MKLREERERETDNTQQTFDSMRRNLYFEIWRRILHRMWAMWIVFRDIVRQREEEIEEEDNDDDDNDLLHIIPEHCALSRSLDLLQFQNEVEKCSKMEVATMIHFH